MKVKLTNVRLFFPDLFVAKQFDGQGEFRYGATFGVDKDGPVAKAIDDVISKVAAEAWKTKSKAMLESIKGNANKFCYTDGAAKTWEGADGYMVLSARRKQKDGAPTVYLADKTVISADNGELYSGCYVNATVDIWAQVDKYPGVRCTLLGVQFNRDGDAFSGAQRADDSDFESIAEGADEPSLV